MTARIRLLPGETVVCKGKYFVIVSTLDLDTVLAEEISTRKSERLRIAELSPVPSQVTAVQNHEPEIAAVPDDDWSVAQQRLDAIEPLLRLSGRTRKDVKARAAEVKVNPATLYRWIKAFQSTGRLSSLLPTQISRSKGQIRIPDQVETLIRSAIEAVYKPPVLSIKKTYEEVKTLCLRANLDPPSIGTVRNRIMMMSDEEKVKRRQGPRAARDKYQPSLDEFPGATTPLAVIQIDHTRLRPILVDDRDREPIGRPWLTLAVDVFSRVIYGMYLSLEAPGAINTGLCLVHGILPKDRWLANHGVTERWPVWGIPGTVHSDNGGDFRGDMMVLAAKNLNFILAWRPVKNPKYGGHIESLCGTLKADLDNEVPGVIPKHLNGNEYYDAEKEACITLSELETWLAQYITREYHQRRHSGIGTSPLKRFEDGIFGSDDRPAVGLPDVQVDERTIRLNLMPYDERTVQQYGILWDGVYYYSDVLRPWINSTEPGTNGKDKRKFIVRRDPRDISHIYFYDPDLQEHFDIPYRNPNRPPITLWELKASRKLLESKGIKDIDEDKIFQARQERKEHVERSKKETKRVRRDRQRTNQALKGASQDKVVILNGVRDSVKEHANNNDELNYDDISAFDDIDDLKIHD